MSRSLHSRIPNHVKRVNRELEAVFSFLPMLQLTVDLKSPVDDLQGRPSSSVARIWCLYPVMRLQHFAITLSFVSLALARTIYTVPHSGNGDDDTPALTQAFANNPSLAANSVILFQKGVTYSLLTPVNFPYLQNVTISVQGNLTCGPADIGKTQGANPETT